ncbi:unnamed protein product [Clonostachys chloroleuca]|uniref:Tail specific protease domain-containing protein n=1 Tax=Clonostachys chloroleuca TaxID=1926264 RepID=A0AA35VH54_9HYPO|nr:unnamed protein product [Clonostachys chloroleuca]
MRCNGFGVVSWLAAVQLCAAASSPCKQIADDQLKLASSLDLSFPSDIRYLAGFDAELAFQCVTSVALDAQDATDMLAYIKKYFSFQSTLAYLKNPPKSYQQLPVDVMGRLDAIGKKITGEAYSSQYALELDIQAVIRDAHEGHLSYNAGVIGLFTWFLPDGLVSISSDGQEIPEIYANSDIIGKVSNASPIVQLQGQSPFSYLRSYLERTTAAMGLIDPHAEWNQLMVNSANQFSRTGTSGDSSIAYDFFQSTTIYNGKSIQGKFKNGTSFEWAYKAGASINLTDYSYTSAKGIKKGRVTNEKTSSVKTLSVNNLIPESIKITEVEGAPGSPRSNIPYRSYPRNPVVVQSNFSVGGTVSGYVLEDESIGVLSIPNFAANSLANAATFSDTVKSFIKQAKSANATKIVIDLSGNGGGTVFLAFDVFRQFFPRIQPTPLFRARAISELRTYGNVITGLIENKDNVLDNTIVQPVRNFYNNSGFLNKRFTRTTGGTPWKSYNEFFGPIKSSNTEDNFTNNAQYDYSSKAIRDELGFYIANYGDNTVSYEQPWKADDIILLTDGYCASTCHTFAAMMKTDASVKTVVVGGIPQSGPMQGVGGTRGSNDRAFSYISGTTDTINNIRSLAGSKFNTFLGKIGVTTNDITNLPGLLSDAPWFVDTRAAGVNMLDSILPKSPDMPRQFVYEAANCRLFWTGDMVRDISVLWKTAAKFAGGDKSVCVRNSTNGPGSQVNDTIIENPGYSYNKTWENANSTSMSTTNSSNDESNNSGNGGGGDSTTNKPGGEGDNNNGGGSQTNVINDNGATVNSVGMMALACAFFTLFLDL